MREITPFQKIGSPSTAVLPKGTKDFTPKADADPKASPVPESVKKSPGEETQSKSPLPESQSPAPTVSGSPQSLQPPAQPVDNILSPPTLGPPPVSVASASAVKVEKDQIETS